MIVTYDAEVDAAYIYLKAPATADVARTVICDEPGAAGAFHLDLDEQGRLVGIEVLNARKALPASLLAEAVRPDSFIAPEVLSL